VAAQGLLLGVLPIIRSAGDIHYGIWILGLSTILSKGILLPWLMTVCVRLSGIRREIELFIGFGASLLCGTALLALAVWITARLQLPGEAPHSICSTNEHML